MVQYWERKTGCSRVNQFQLQEISREMTTGCSRVKQFRLQEMSREMKTGCPRVTSTVPCDRIGVR